MKNIFDGMTIHQTIKRLFEMSGIPSEIPESETGEELIARLRAETKARMQEMADEGIGEFIESSVGVSWHFDVT